MKNDNIYNVLNQYLKRNNGSSTNEVICRYMMEHLLEIPQMSVNEIADACYTSHPSIIRFTRELGFEGFSDFKYTIQSYIDEIHARELRISFPVDTQSDDTQFKRQLQEWLNNQSEIIVSSIGNTDREKIKHLCEEIHSHNKVALVGAGLSDVVLGLFRIMLARYGKIVNNIGTQADGLEAYEHTETLVIILSMNGLFLDVASRNTGKQNMKQNLTSHSDKSYLITMNKDVKNTLTDETILIDCAHTTFDYALNTAIVYFELVAQCYQEMYP